MISFSICCPDDIESAAEQLGFLPYFASPIKGFSIEEHTAPGLWFAPDVDGPWEWKGPVVRRMNVAYGKFFRAKAVYVSLDWLPHLVNYRRSVRVLSADEHEVLNSISANESLLSTDIRQMCGFSRLSDEDMLLSNGNQRHLHSLDTILTRLQMSGHIVVSDFEYKIDKHGHPYGWGVARFSTPEILYAGRFELPTISPCESRNLIISHLSSLFPDANIRVIHSLV